VSATTSTNTEFSRSEHDQIHEFIGRNSNYYIEQFDRLVGNPGYSWTFNWFAAIFGPIWLAARQLWSLFWVFFFLELMAFVQIARGLWADLGFEQFARSERLANTAAQRLQEAEVAASKGVANASNIMESAQALAQAAQEAMTKSQIQAETAPWLVIGGVLFLLIVKLIEGGYGNWTLFKRFTRWQADRSLKFGVNPTHVVGASILTLALSALTIYRFTTNSVPGWLENVPTKRSWRIDLSQTVDQFFEWFTLAGEDFFSFITLVIRSLLDGMDILLVDTPWPVVMIVIILLSLQLAGPRVAIFTTACLAYLGLLGFWEKSMETVSLLGTAAFICIVLGLPLGIWCAKNNRAYTIVRPILDLMQTMPSFVYLIPVIAFFGIGKAPGVVATVVFGMPPVVRLTVLGLYGVPQSVREAAIAFGVSKRFLLFRVDLPLALPSIMTGINQTILMCLSMVVIASLIGAKGLGEDVLHALTYADEGQGILAGLAILFCAMILDRIVQGRRKRTILES
jgi:glycine betaine/proline transport system permease protein